MLQIQLESQIINLKMVSDFIFKLNEIKINLNIINIIIKSIE